MMVCLAHPTELRTRPQLLRWMRSWPTAPLSVAAALAEHVQALGPAGIASVVARFELPLPIELGRELRALPNAGSSRRVRARDPFQADEQFPLGGSPPRGSRSRSPARRRQ